MRVKSRDILIVLFTVLSTNSSVIAEETEVQSIKQVYELIASNNSDVRAISIRSRGMRALIEQANQLPNPQLEVESENFGGDRSDFDESENTFAISQLVELGGKRGARADLATAESQLFEAKAKIRLAAILGKTQAAYANAILSQTRLKLATERARFAKEILKTVQEKVRLGGILAGEETKAQIAVQLAKIDIQKAENLHVQNKRNLASLWNGTVGDVGELVSLSQAEEGEDFKALEVQSFPRLRVQSLQIAVAKRGLDRERAQAIPDLTLSGGYRRFEETDDGAFVAGLSIPLPIFNRNEGRIAQANGEVSASQALLQKETVATKAELDSLVQLRGVLQQERSIIETSLLPNSKKGLEQMREAYRLGRVGYLDLVDSQQAYFDTRIRAAENLFSLIDNDAKLKALTGVILNDFEGVIHAN